MGNNGPAILNFLFPFSPWVLISLYDSGDKDQSILIYENYYADFGLATLNLIPHYFLLREK